MTYKQINRKINKIYKWIDNVDLKSDKFNSYNYNIKYWKGYFFIITGEKKYSDSDITIPIIEQFKSSEKEQFKIRVIQELMK